MTTAAAPRSAARPRPATAVFVVASAFVASALAAAGIAAGTDPEDGWQHAARYTARCSFLLFVPVFIASSWNRLWPSGLSRAVVRRRRALGLAFAAAHTVHLYALVTYSRMAGNTPDAVTGIVGGGAYVAMFAMVATSNDAAVRWLGASWRRLHKVGIYWLWFVFTFTYAGRVAGGKVDFVPLLAAALAAQGLRIAAWRRVRARRAAA